MKFEAAFHDEMAKLAKKKGFSLPKIAQPFVTAIHNPITQAAGYLALAGEGAHFLGDAGKLGKGVQRFAHTGVGKSLGTGAVGASSLFLFGEGMSALMQAMGRARG